MTEFFKEMAPHLGANMLTLLLVYGVMSASKAERRGDASLYGLGSIVAVSAFMLYGIYLHGGFDALR